MRCWLAVFLLAGLLVTTPGTWAALPSEVTVHLLESSPGVRTITLHGPFRLQRNGRNTVHAGTYTVMSHQGRLELSQRGRSILQTPRMSLDAISERGVTLQAAHRPPRRYPGRLILTAQAGALRIENRLPARTYVALVVAGETWPGWPDEALKAQALLTQTRLARYRPGDPLGDSTQQEAYFGLEHRRAEADRAVQSVWGSIVTYQHRPIEPLYHAACAGGTSDGSYFTGKNTLPYLRHVACRACQGAPLNRITRTGIRKGDFEKVFGPGVPQVIRQDTAGRPLAFRLANGQLQSGYETWLRLGQRFGWDKAPGTRFAFHLDKKDTITITSSGGGHGVGMCQWGAAALARQGWTAEQILRHYFPGTAVSRF